MSTITVGENKGKDKEAVMEKAKISVIRGVGVFVAFFLFLLSVGETQGAGPKPFVVECPGGSIQAELDGVQPGETLTVSGTCNENVVIPEEIHRITLDGQGTATINGTLTIRGKGITIMGFTITGGGDGIVVISGQAIIRDNTISNNVGSGILIEGVSQADVFINEIDGNGQDGIKLTENSGVNLSGNSTDVSNNVGFGLSCTIGAYASGSIGTLNGTIEATSFDGTCINDL